MASFTETLPSFRRLRRRSTAARSMATSANLLPLLELQDGAQGAAALDLLPDPVLALEHVEGAVGHLHAELLGHYDHPGLVADDPVTRANGLAAALDLLADGALAFRLARMGRGMPAEQGEVQVQDRVDVPRAAVDHDSGHALHEGGVRRELPPDGRRPAAHIHDDHVAGLRAVDRLDGFGPVPVRRLHGEGAAHELLPVLDPRQDAVHDAALLHGIRDVRGRDLAEGLDHVRLRVLLVEARGDGLALPDGL